MPSTQRPTPPGPVDQQPEQERRAGLREARRGAEQFLAQAVAKGAEDGGEGIGIVAESTPSPAILK